MHQSWFLVDGSAAAALLAVVVVAPGVHVPGVGDGEAVQRAHRHVDYLLPPETLHDGRLPHVLVSAVAEAEVVPLAPGPHRPGLGHGEAELSPALDLDYPHTVQLLHVSGHGAALAAAAAQLAEVPVAPAEHHALVREGEGLGVPAAARHLHHPVARQSLDTLGPQLRHVVPVAQPPVLAAAPGVQLAAGGDGGAVGAAARDVPHPLVLQRLYQPRLVNGHPGAVAQLAVVPLAPAEHSAVHGERHGVLAAAVHRHLLDHVLAEGAELPRHGHVAAVAQAEPPVGSLATGVHLAIAGHQEQRLGPSGNGHGV